MEFHAIGLMSGTSLDGLDICFVRFQFDGGDWNFKILHAETVGYSEEWEFKLRNSTQLSSAKLLALNSEYGFYLGEQVQKFIRENQLSNVDLVASHGHTVFHQPQNKFTLQIGDGRAINTMVKIPVVYDFRSQDVLMGGNGAPLVPIGDELLFAGYDACVNLGGFSNISFKANKRRVAFDICPVNIVLNRFAKVLNLNYDKNGAIARSGKIIPELLNSLNALPYYTYAPPKSLGIEWVEENIDPLIQDQSTEDLLATFTEHAALQIAETLGKFDLKKVFFTGGGTYNSFLMEKIKTKCRAEIIIPEKEIIDYKEALIFAFMGVLKLNNKINVLSSSTGSTEDHSSGLVV